MIIVPYIWAKDRFNYEANTKQLAFETDFKAS